MQTPHQMHRMTRVVLPSGEHDVLSMGALVTLAHDAELSVEYPPPGGPGWATTRLGATRFAAWYQPEVGS